MEFKIEATSTWDAEPILQRYPCLSNYSFRIEETKIPKAIKFRDETNNLLTQEMMITKKTPYVSITTIDELMQFIKDVKYPVIVGDVDIYDNPIPTIEIYDSWRE